MLRLPKISGSSIQTLVQLIIYTLYAIHYTFYIIQYTLYYSTLLYSIQYKPYTIQYALYNRQVSRCLPSLSA